MALYLITRRHRHNRAIYSSVPNLKERDVHHSPLCPLRKDSGMASNPEIPYEENPWQLRLEFSLPILEVSVRFSTRTVYCAHAPRRFHQRLPEDSNLSAEDRRRISNIHAQKITNECLIWEDLTNRYADSISAPYFETQLARTFLKLGAVGLGLIHYRKV